MSRYLSKKLLAIHLVAISAIVISLFLSNWQWKKAHYFNSIELTDQIADFQELSPLRDFLQPNSVGVRTKVSGIWQPNSRLEFSNRPIDGEQLLKTQMSTGELGKWIMDILILSDGSSLGVVRGFTDSQIDIPNPSGPVTLTGVMQPSENSFKSSLVDLPNLITTDIILEKAQSILHDGYFISSTKATDLELVKPILNSPQKAQLHWRNVIYTANWIIFAIIFAGMWWRIIQMEISSKEEE